MQVASPLLWSPLPHQGTQEMKSVVETWRSTWPVHTSPRSSGLVPQNAILCSFFLSCQDLE